MLSSSTAQGFPVQSLQQFKNAKNGRIERKLDGLIDDMWHVIKDIAED